MAKFLAKCLLGLSLIVTGSSAFAGINNVEYRLVYNTTTCMYDVVMTVLNGSTSTGDEEAAYTAQVSIVVPATATVGTTSIVSNEPKIGAQVGSVATRGNTPAVWSFTLSTAFTDINANNAAAKVYAFTVTTSNAFYPTLSTSSNNNEVVLFSIPISGMQPCGGGVRMWNNNFTQGTATPTGADPASSATGFNGQDYNNGITFAYISGSRIRTKQTYSQNNTTITPPKPDVTAKAVISGNTIQLSATYFSLNACAGTPTYSWSGPNGLIGTTQNTTVSTLTSNAFGPYTVSVTDAAGCSSVASTARVPLPVTIARFDGTASRCNAILNWETSSESNFDRFEVQYSADGKSFMSVGEVAGKKLPAGSAYTFSYAQATGKGYYRLKMLDRDRSYGVSETVSVQTSCGTSATAITIAPNPTSGLVNIRGVQAGNEVRVIDMLGKVVASQIATEATMSVNLGAYANGIYNVLVAQDGGWAKVGQIVKN